LPSAPHCNRVLPFITFMCVLQVIAALTVGKDMSPLFPDVINCMQTGGSVVNVRLLPLLLTLLYTEDMELKKLVYLYLMNYAKSNPDLAIMAVNTFVKVSDSGDPTSGTDVVCTFCVAIGRIQPTARR
jgi:AP-1 complex subunit beta-1